MADGHHQHDPLSADAVPGPAGPAGEGDTRRPRWVVPTAIALVITLVGALVFTAWFGIKLVQGFGVEQGRSNALSAAKDVAVNFTTYDAATVEADVQRLVAGFTPSLGSEGVQKSVRDQVARGQARSAGEVSEAGVISYDPVAQTARVLVSVRAKVSTKEAADQDRVYRMELLMVERGDWLADRVEFVS